MAEHWKTEYHIIAEDGEARNWLDTLEEAKALLVPSDKRIDKVTYYHNNYETVWDRNNEA